MKNHKRKRRMHTLTLSDDAVAIADHVARRLGMTRSAYVEALIRGTIPHNPQAPESEARRLADVDSVIP